MRTLVTAVFAAALLGAAAQAMPALHAGLAGSPVVAVANGCGRAEHRGRDGRCYQDYHPRRLPVCRPGFKPGLYFRCVPNL